MASGNCAGAIYLRIPSRKHARLQHARALLDVDGHGSPVPRAASIVMSWPCLVAWLHITDLPCWPGLTHAATKPCSIQSASLLSSPCSSLLFIPCFILLELGACRSLGQDVAGVGIGSHMVWQGSILQHDEPITVFVFQYPLALGRPGKRMGILSW